MDGNARGSSGNRNSLPLRGEGGVGSQRTRALLVDIKRCIGCRACVGACKEVHGFPGDDIQKHCRLLSGGEKVRLVLARMLYDPPNFLVLDEPTNHLDLATREMLIEALAKYEGTMLLVSHDRRFLSALTDHVLELEAGNPPRVYGGGYAEYVAASGHEAPGMRS